MPGPNRVRRRLGSKATTNPLLGIPGLVFWVKADQIAGLADGTSVATWADQSGNGNDLTQATGGNQPVYKTAVQNGLPVVRFNAANSNYMSSPAFALPQPTTVFFVAKGAAATTDYCDAATPINTRVVQFGGNTTTVSLYAGAFMNVTVATTQIAFNSFIAIFNGASSLLTYNGVDSSAGNPSTGAGASGIRLAASGGTPGSFQSIDAAEWGCFNRALTSSERASLQSYLKTKWGTP